MEWLITANHDWRSGIRVQELCESGGGRPGPPVPNSPCGFCGRKATLNLKFRLCCKKSFIYEWASCNVISGHEVCRFVCRKSKVRKLVGFLSLSVVVSASIKRRVVSVVGPAFSKRWNEEFLQDVRHQDAYLSKMWVYLVSIIYCMAGENHVSVVCMWRLSSAYYSLYFLRMFVTAEENCHFMPEFCRHQYTYRESQCAFCVGRFALAVRR